MSATRIIMLLLLAQAAVGQNVYRLQVGSHYISPAYEVMFPSTVVEIPVKAGGQK